MEYELSKENESFRKLISGIVNFGSFSLLAGFSEGMIIVTNMLFKKNCVKEDLFNSLN